MATKKTEDELIAWADSVSGDPLQFVIDAFPWGEPFTDLEKHPGPDEWQREILENVRDNLLDLSSAIRLAVASGHGIGKMLDNREQLPTPLGWKPIGEIKIGDEVFAPDGTPTKVAAVFPQGRKELYRVWFDDGSYSDAGLDHKWAVRGRQDRRIKREGWRVLTTRQILEVGVKRPNGTVEARQWEIPRQEAVQYPWISLPFNPYTLGLWLGNGSKNKGSITQPREPEWETFALRHNIRVKAHKFRNCDDWRVPYLQKALREMGILSLGSHQRYIPTEYMTAHIEARKSMLAGLLDTDGTIDESGVICFDSTSEELVIDVVELARSLGGKARKQASIKNPFYRGADGEKIYCRPCHRATLQMPFNPFRISRKGDRWRNCERRYMSRWIDRIEYLHDAPATCISVEHETHCFLTRDYIVTHNSALVSWLILWALITKEDTMGVVTANTETQLRTKTWAQLAKWHRLCIAGHWFHFTATAIYSVDKKHEKTWRVDAVSWSENRTESFAGLHNEGKRILLVFDEASAIPDIIWEVSEGALTDKETEIIWAAFGNPTRNSGRFKECFGRFRHRWKTKQIDSRTSRLTNAKEIAGWVADYGEDSDFVRVRVRGMFPRAGSLQFISIEVVEEAMRREGGATIYDPFLISVDVGRFGDDPSVINFRRGRDAKTIPQIVLQGLDTQQVAARVAEEFFFYKADGVFVDGGGPGGGVVDRLRVLKVPVIEVQFGSASDRDSHGEDDNMVYANKRAEMWGNMRKWLKGGSLPNDPELLADLTGVEYGYTIREGRDAVILEKKEDMKKRGLASPNKADALAISFAYPIAPSDHRTVSFGGGTRFESEYNPLASGWASAKSRR